MLQREVALCTRRLPHGRYVPELRIRRQVACPQSPCNKLHLNLQSFPTCSFGGNLKLGDQEPKALLTMHQVLRHPDWLRSGPQREVALLSLGGREVCAHNIPTQSSSEMERETHPDVLRHVRTDTYLNAVRSVHHLDALQMLRQMRQWEDGNLLIFDGCNHTPKTGQGCHLPQPGTEKQQAAETSCGLWLARRQKFALR